ncbi:MAG: rhomboid family intramembrane serine protease, partial [Planctomycetota bacterium]|nr:rhomboid family intramembrane serine protease [Planctomycetota bacterium]
MSDFVHCKYCGHEVVPTATGECPGCRQIIAIVEEAVDPLPSEPKFTDEAPLEIVSFQEEVAPPNDAPHGNRSSREAVRGSTTILPASLIELRRMEREVDGTRGKLFQGTTGRVSLTTEVATRIQTELIPWLERRLSTLSSSQAAEFDRDGARPSEAAIFESRVTAWRGLLAAAETKDRQRAVLAREAWNHSEFLLMWLAEFEKAVAKQTPNLFVPRFAFFRSLFQRCGLPWMTLLLAAVCVYVFVSKTMAVMSFRQEPIEMLADFGANFGPLTIPRGWWRLGTGQLLHVTFFPLVINMLCLGVLGMTRESLLGRFGMLAVCLLSGAIAGSIRLYVNPLFLSPGISAAVWGVAGAGVGVILLAGNSIPRSILRGELRTLVGLAAIGGVVSPMLFPVDHLANVSGLLTGLMFGVVMGAPFNSRFLPTRLERSLRILPVAALLLGISIPLTYYRHADGMAEMAALELDHPRLFQRYDETCNKWNRAEISDEEFRRQTANDVVPGVRSLRARWHALAERYSATRNLTEHRDVCLALNEKYYEAVVRHLDSPDSAAAAHEVERLLAECQSCNQEFEDLIAERRRAGRSIESLADYRAKKGAPEKREGLTAGTGRQPTIPQPRVEPTLSLPELVEQVRGRVVRIRCESEAGIGSSGSGFVLDSTGLIATNYHVLSGASKAVVDFTDGRKLSVIGLRAWDAVADLAILELEPDIERTNSISPLPLAPPGSRQPAMDVVAMGHPLGLDLTTTVGILNGIQKTENLPHEVRKHLTLAAEGTWLQTTAVVAGGSSGGPLLNRAGQVIGVNTWIHDNFCFALDIDLLRKLQGKITRDAVPLARVTAPHEKLSQLAAELRERMRALGQEAAGWPPAEHEQNMRARHPLIDSSRELCDLARNFPDSPAAFESLHLFCTYSTTFHFVSAECDRRIESDVLPFYRTHVDDERLVKTLWNLRSGSAPE